MIFATSVRGEEVGREGVPRIMRMNRGPGASPFDRLQETQAGQRLLK